MNNLLFLVFCFLNIHVFAQRPSLNKEMPLLLSKHINSKNLILDYLITEDATCSLFIQDSSRTLYLLKEKFLEKNQYEMSLNASLFKADTSFIKLECSYGMFELLQPSALINKKSEME